MANLLTSGLWYNPYFYAQEGLRVLYKRLGLAFYVKRDLAAGKGSGTGDTVQVRRAQTFTAVNMPIAVASFADVNPQYDNLLIGSWMGQGFKLTDKEKTLTPEVFVRDHLAPVANSIADQIDQNLASLTLEVPWQQLGDATNPYKDFPNGRKILLDNKNPIITPAEYFYMTDSVLEARYETDPTFVQAQSDADSGDLQRTGQLGVKWGFRIFPNQNATTFAGSSGTGAGAHVAGPHGPPRGVRPGHAAARGRGAGHRVRDDRGRRDGPHAALPHLGRRRHGRDGLVPRRAVGLQDAEPEPRGTHRDLTTGFARGSSDPRVP